MQGVLEEPGEDVERRGGEVTRSVGGREKTHASGGTEGRRGGPAEEREGEGTGGSRAEF